MVYSIQYDSLMSAFCALTFGTAKAPFHLCVLGEGHDKLLASILILLHCVNIYVCMS